MKFFVKIKLNLLKLLYCFLYVSNYELTCLSILFNCIIKFFIIIFLSFLQQRFLIRLFRLILLFLLLILLFGLILLFLSKGQFRLLKLMLCCKCHFINVQLLFLLLLRFLNFFNLFLWSHLISNILWLLQGHIFHSHQTHWI